MNPPFKPHSLNHLNFPKITSKYHKPKTTSHLSFLKSKTSLFPFFFSPNPRPQNQIHQDPSYFPRSSLNQVYFVILVRVLKYKLKDSQGFNHTSFIIIQVSLQKFIFFISSSICYDYIVFIQYFMHMLALTTHNIHLCL